MRLPTVKVKADNDDGFRLINESDFDAKKHTKYDPDKKAAPKKKVAKKKASKK